MEQDTMNKNLIAHSFKSGDRTNDVTIQSDISFQSMFLSPKVFEGLSICGFRKPSPIQLKTIPLGRCGFDLIVKSKSGTGKTLVFSVIGLETVDPTIQELQVLILAPTREIAVQIGDVISNVGQSLTGLKVCTFIGGLPEKQDIEKAKNCHIAVGAPGRVKSLIKQKVLKVEDIKLFILDEADKLMETNFQDDINEIYYNLPTRKQIIATSATFPEELQKFLSNYMQSPTEVTAEIETPLLLGLKQFIKEAKPSTNVSQEMKNKNEELLKLLGSISFSQCLIFSNYQSRAESVSLSINRHGFNSTFISAAQTQTKRIEVMNSLKDFKCRILLSTDLTARGIDGANVDLIINYDIPVDVMTYLHRMGRAGRFGSKGLCVSLVSGNKDLKQIQKYLGYIGGKNLTISKLTEEHLKKDLWKTDPKELEQVAGIIEEENEKNDVSINIKKEVLLLKCNSGEIKKNKKKKSKLDKNVCESQNNENTLQDLSSLEITEADPTEIEKDDSLALLESMAAGTFNFGNESSQESADKITSESTRILDSTEDKKRKRIPDLTDDPKAILELLANKEFDFLKVSEGDSEEISSIKADNMFDHVDEKKLKNRKCEVDDEYKNKIYTKNRALYETVKVLTDQVTCVDADMEQNLNNYFKALQDDQNNSIKNYLGNVEEESSLSSAKNSEETYRQDHNLDNIFIHGYKFAVDGKHHWKNFIPAKELEQKVEDSEMTDLATEEPEEYNEDEIWEDNCEDYEDCPGIKIDENGKRIYSYEDIPNRMVWVPVERSVLESNKVYQINLLETDDDMAEDSTSKTDIEDTNEAAAYHDNSYLRMTLAHQDMSEESGIVISQNEPLQYLNTSSSRDINEEHFIGCFRQCSDDLWNNGRMFNSVEDFDNWFYQWQRRVQHVSDYVRQNIYVREMSNYQNSVGKWQ